MRLTKDGTINDTDSVLDTLIIQLLMKRQKSLCYGCNEPLIGYQLHHKRYGLDIGLDDLALLCSPCHGAGAYRYRVCGGAGIHPRGNQPRPAPCRHGPIQPAICAKTIAMVETRRTGEVVRGDGAWPFARHRYPQLLEGERI